MDAKASINKFSFRAYSRDSRAKIICIFVVLVVLVVVQSTC